MKGAPPGRSFDAVVKRCTVCGERLVSKYSNTRRKREKKKKEGLLLPSARMWIPKGVILSADLRTRKCLNVDSTPSSQD